MNNINIRLSILSLPRFIKRFIAMLTDSTLCIFAVWFAYFLRVGYFIPVWEGHNEYNPIPAYLIAIIVSLPIFMLFNLYKTIFRYSGIPVIIMICKATAIFAIIYITIFTIIGISGVPRTIGIIQPVILLALIILSRFIALLWLGELYLDQLKQNKKSRVLVYGTDQNSRKLIAALKQSNELNVVGYIDENSSLYGNEIDGLSIYNPDTLDQILIKQKIREILLAVPNIDRNLRNKLLEKTKGKNIVIRSLPRFEDLLQGRVTTKDIKELSIDNILGREVINPDPKLMQRDIKGKSVLVTGAGGSIGSELCRQIFTQKPKQLILLDHGEFALYTIFEEIKKLSAKMKSSTNIIPCLANITDKKRIENLLEEFNPQTIFHAAAYKHVPLVEDNKIEGIKNNVLGTLILSQLAIKNEIKKFVLVSTDKAVRPTNVMGASKRLAEMILQALSSIQNKTIFAIVRFGNVLDSSGSVIPLFRSQIKSGGPVTVTHQKVTRYFMTITEASQLVIQSGAMTVNFPKKNDGAPIYLLDMGKPIKIYELARLMIEFSGLTILNKDKGDGDIEIKIIGLRQGEKLHEELLTGSKANDTNHPKIKIANEPYLHWPKLRSYLNYLEKAIHNSDTKSILETLKKLTS